MCCALFGDAKAMVLGCDTPTIVVQPLPDTVCAGANASYELEATGAGLEYIWFLNGVELGDSDPAFSITSVVAADSGAVYCLVYNSCDTVSSDTVGLVVVPATPITISAHPSDTTVCTGDSITFEVQHQGATSFEWLVNNVSQETNAAQFQLLDIEQGTTQLYCVLSNTCNTEFSQVATVEALPLPQWQLQPPNVVADSGDTVLLALQATGPNLQYLWMFNGDTLSVNDSLAFLGLTAADTGTYSYLAISTCGTLFGQVHIAFPLPDAIDEALLVAQIDVWPNPATTQLTVRSSEPISYVRLLDAAGRLVRQQAVGGATMLTLEMPPAGLYFLHLQTAAGSVQKRVLVTGR